MLIKRISIAVGSWSLSLRFMLPLSLLQLDCPRFGPVKMRLILRITSQRITNILVHCFPVSFRWFGNPDVFISSLELVTGLYKWFNAILPIPILNGPKSIFQTTLNFAIELKLQPISFKMPANVINIFILFTSEATDCEAPRTSSFNELISDLWSRTSNSSSIGPVKQIQFA